MHVQIVKRSVTSVSAIQAANSSGQPPATPESELPSATIAALVWSSQSGAVRPDSGGIAHEAVFLLAGDERNKVSVAKQCPANQCTSQYLDYAQIAAQQTELWPAWQHLPCCPAVMWTTASSPTSRAARIWYAVAAKCVRRVLRRSSFLRLRVRWTISRTRQLVNADPDAAAYRILVRGCPHVIAQHVGVPLRPLRPRAMPVHPTLALAGRVRSVACSVCTRLARARQ